MEQQHDAAAADRGRRLRDKNYFVSLLRKNRLLKYQLYQHQLQYRKNESELAQLGVHAKKRKDDQPPPPPFVGSCLPRVVVRKLGTTLNFKRNKKQTPHPHHAHVSSQARDWALCPSSVSSSSL